MKVRALFSALLVAAVCEAAATPGYPVAAPRCADDRCQKAVSRGPSNCPTAKADAKKHCSSFLVTTISPCPATRTTTSTKTATAIAVTSTSFVTVSSLVINTRTDVATTVETDISSVTDTETALHTDSVTLTAVVTAFETATVTNLVTVTETLTTTGAPVIIERNLIERVQSACPARQTASKIPSYAVCNGRVAYASACSCLGVAPRTTTLPARTATITTIKTVTITPTRLIAATVTAFSVSIQRIATTVTRTLSVTVRVTVTTDVAVVETETVSETATVTETQTDLATTTEDAIVTVTPTIKSQSIPCRLQAVTNPAGSPIDGFYLRGPGGFWGNLDFVENYTDAGAWYLDDQQHLHLNGTDTIAVGHGQEGYRVYIYMYGPGKPNSMQVGPEFALVCSYAENVLAFCTVQGEEYRFFTRADVNVLYLSLPENPDPVFYPEVQFRRVCSAPS